MTVVSVGQLTLTLRDLHWLHPVFVFICCRVITDRKLATLPTYDYPLFESRRSCSLDSLIEVGTRAQDAHESLINPVSEKGMLEKVSYSQKIL